MQTLEGAWFRAIKRATRLPTYTPREAIQADMDIMPLSSRRTLLTLNLFHHIASQPATTITRRVLQEGFDLWCKRKAVRSNWCHGVHQELESLGLEHLIDPNEAAQISHLTWQSLIKKHIQTLFVKSWREACELKPHLSLLLAGKEKPSQASYTKSSDRSFQTVALLIRAQSLPLAVCKPAARHAKFNGPKATDVCPKCQTDKEDLHHFLFQCPAYDHLRSRDPLAELQDQIIQASETTLKLWNRMWNFRTKSIGHKWWLGATKKKKKKKKKNQ
jgi:hypothetical protein